MASSTTELKMSSTTPVVMSEFQHYINTERSSSSSPISKLNDKMNVGDLSMSLQHFGWADYFVFVVMLAVCAAIGVYFGFVEKNNSKGGKGGKDGKRKIEQRRGSEALDYLVGGRKMKVFPVSMSLVASFVSGISLLGTSTEIYVYGTQYAFILLTIGFSGVVSWFIFLPVFCNLQLTSTYEYFELRFDRRIRLFGSILFCVGIIFWLPIAIYVPALTFNQVTGVNIHVITPVVCAVCTFYTCVGGIKAVVWTDVIQSFFMMGSIILVIVKGTMDLGGLGVVWQRNYDSGRIELPEWTLDPTVRLSMLSVFVGGSLHKLQSSCVNQISVQRFLSLPSIKEAKRCLIYFNIGLIVLLGSCVYTGLLTYATYYDCDPLTTKLAKATDQLVPLLVMHILGIFPGLPGLFVSGVFSAALSSLSTGLNSLAAVILEDLVKPFKKTPLSERHTAILLRSIVFFFGVSCIGLVVVVEKLGMVLQLSTTLAAVTQGPVLGIFIVGICMPWINGKSALTAGAGAFSLLTWICLKSQIAVATGQLTFPKKPVSVEGCTYTFNSTSVPLEPNPSVAIPVEKSIYHMSFLFYAALGVILTVGGSILLSFVFGTNDTSEVDPRLIAPCLRRFMKQKKYVPVEMIKSNGDHKEPITKVAV